jgi:hypothetical protein
MPSLGIVTVAGSTSAISHISGMTVSLAGVSTTQRCSCGPMLSWVSRLNDREILFGRAKSPFGGCPATRNCITPGSGGGRTGLTFTQFTRRPRNTPKSTSTSARSPGASVSPAAGGFTGAGSRPASEPICQTALLASVAGTGVPSS